MAGAKARWPSSKAKPDLVVVAIGTWDEQFSHYFADMEKAAPAFRDAILEAFPDSIIVLRLSHGVCCQRFFIENYRISGARFQHWNDIMRKVWKVNEAGTHAMDGRVLVLNSGPFGGTKDERVDYKNHFSPHLRFSRVRTEVQMLLNTVCTKDEKTGKARWRW